MFAEELAKTLRRTRTLVFLVVLAAIPVVYAVVVRLAGKGPADGPPYLGQASQSGVFVGFAGLTTIALGVLPLVLAAVAGDAVAGEADTGSLRYILTAPVPRSRFLIVKFGVIMSFALIAAALVAITGLLAGVVLFGLAPPPTASGTAVPAADSLLSGPTLPLLAALARVMLASVIVALQLTGLVAAAVLLSTLTTAPLVAVAGSIGVFAAGQVLQAKVGFLRPLQPWLFNNYWDAFFSLFSTQVAVGDIVRSLAVQLPYLLVCGAVAIVHFRRKDILS